jgi:prevent-host-death family protein
MNNTWSLSEAKAKLSEVVRRARKTPQIITVRGVPKVEFISIAEYLRGGGKMSDFDDDPPGSSTPKPRKKSRK